MRDIFPFFIWKNSHFSLFWRHSFGLKLWSSFTGQKMVEQVKTGTGTSVKFEGRPTAQSPQLIFLATEICLLCRLNNYTVSQCDNYCCQSTKHLVWRPQTLPGHLSLFEFWLFQFLSERVEVAKYCSQPQVDIFCTIIHRSLSINVGRPVSQLSRHVNAIGPRVLLLNIGLSLLQSKNFLVIKNWIYTPGLIKINKHVTIGYSVYHFYQKYMLYKILLSIYQVWVELCCLGLLLL